MCHPGTLASWLWRVQRLADQLPRPEHPRPQLLRESWLSLNGVWEFEVDTGRSGRERGRAEAAHLDGEILVPFCPESKLSGIGDTDFMPAVWYRRSVTLPDGWLGQPRPPPRRRRRLRVGGLRQRALGGHPPRRLDARHAGDHGLPSIRRELIAIYAEDDTRSPLQPTGKQSPRYESFACFYTRTTGIWQTVWLEAVPETFVSKVRLTPDLESGSVLVEATIDGPDLGVVARGGRTGGRQGRRRGQLAADRRTGRWRSSSSR